MYFAVWDQGPPRHYTYLKIFKDTVTRQVQVEYRDSLNPAAPGNLVRAKTILLNLGLQELVERVEPSNEMHQEDSWSCGLFVIKWIEQDVRETARHEPPMQVTIKMAATRINAFIDQIKKKAQIPDKKGAPPAPAPPEVQMLEPKEVQFETLELALDAANACKKCYPTKKGIKGCRQCMGKWFEEIRQQQLPKRVIKKALDKEG